MNAQPKLTLAAIRWAALAAFLLALAGLPF